MLERKRVAAVCYRWNTEGQFELLLVRTRQGHRWTFPKGGIEATDLTPSEGALREAIEEAGVDGVVDPALLLTYFHAAWLGGEAVEEQKVDAYLLCVTTEAGRAEPGRQPTWFDPAAAAAALGENQRAARHAEELRSVLSAARHRLATDGLPADAWPVRAEPVAGDR